MLVSAASPTRGPFSPPEPPWSRPLRTGVAQGAIEPLLIGFSFPVVPQGKARIRVQLSASHSLEDVQQCVDAFIEVGKEKGVIN